MRDTFRRYLLPALVFQSIIIGGGYGTGRELVEFFLQYGPVGGLYGMLGPTLVLVTLCCMVGFEMARRFQAYDYRRFFGELLGPGWILYEITYLVFIVLIMAVLGSAAGNFLEETFAVPYAVGVVGLLVAVAFLVFLGTGVIENVLASWSFVLYGVYLIFFVWAISSFGDEIAAALSEGKVEDGWIGAGVRYAAGTVGVLPAMLFATRHIETRRQALTAGLIAGPVALLPALLFYFAMLGQYPAVLERPVPANFLLEVLGSRAFQIFFQVMLFGTLIETGAGLIHAFNERIAGALETDGRSLPKWARPTVAVVLLAGAAALSRIGIIALIGRGYGTITWAFVLLLIVPLLTVGLWRIRRPEEALRERSGTLRGA
ncbi:MAG: hypothetical protein AAF690_10245 [Acidobacteriota bacterium]